MNQHFCRVCGLYYEEPPWGNDESTPSYEICSCCGVEFGNEDYTVKSTKAYRRVWISRGKNWFYPKEKPITWDIDKQMKSIPREYL